MEPKQTESKTDQAILKLRRELDMMQEMLGALEQRLAPVLAPIPESPKNPTPRDEEAREVLAELPQAIFCAAGHLARMKADISKLLTGMQL